MKNLWRSLAFFMLPGVVLGGGTLVAFFRLFDWELEPLKICTVGALLWSFSAVASILFFNNFKHPERWYYHFCAATAMLFTLGLGGVRFCGLNGYWEGLFGTAFAGWMTVGFIHCFCGDTFKIKERWLFTLGIVSAIGMAWYLNDSMRISWLETFFFYCGEALLIAWVIASPLTVWGKWYRRWAWRMFFLAFAAFAVIHSPQFCFSPWNEAPSDLPDGLWQRTFITSQGSRFLWVGTQGNGGLFTAGGRVITWNRADAELYSAMPGLLGVLKNPHSQIKLITPINSVLPDVVKKLPGNRVVSQIMPESLNPPFKQGPSLLFDKLLKKYISPAEKYDLILVTVLPDNQYEGSIERFFADNCAELKRDAVFAVPENLLRNQTLFRLLNESFEFSGVLPAPGSLWVFSHRKLDMSPEEIDKNLQRLYGSDSPILPGTYTALFSQTSRWQDFVPAPEVERIQWGNNHWFGSWFWLLPGVGLIFLWQLIRLWGERRIELYRYCNSVENGFSAMSCNLLCLELLLINSGIFNLSIVLLALTGAVFILRLRRCSIWILLIGLLILPTAATSEYYLWMLVPVMIVNMLYTGSLQNSTLVSVREQCRLWNWVFIGMLSGACAMLAVWLWKIPLAVIWLWIFAARLAGIWQNKYMRVYYEKEQERKLDQ